MAYEAAACTLLEAKKGSLKQLCFDCLHSLDLCMHC